MRVFRAAAWTTLAAALAAAAAGCYATGERAQGAPGYPAVEYKPCCDPEAQQLPRGGDWGLFCAKPAGCYATGERAQGAEGYPAVEYKPCCDAADQQLPKDGDWGLFCTTPGASCAATGERAQGAEGYPPVEYKPCCNANEVQRPLDGDWGLFCVKPGPSCYVTGERAQGADGYPGVEYAPCCDPADEQLPKEGDWGLFCQKPEGNGADATALQDGAICDTGAKGASGSAPCADGLVCSSDGTVSDLGICAPPGQKVTVNAPVQTKCGTEIDGSAPTYVLCSPNLMCMDRGGGGLDQGFGDNLFCVDANVPEGGLCDSGVKGLAQYRRCAGDASCSFSGIGLSSQGLCVTDSQQDITLGQVGDKCGDKADGTGSTYVFCLGTECADRGGGGVDPRIGDNLYCIRQFAWRNEACDRGLEGRAIYRRCERSFTCEAPSGAESGDQGICVDT